MQDFVLLFLIIFYIFNNILHLLNIYSIYLWKIPSYTT